MRTRKDRRYEALADMAREKYTRWTCPECGTVLLVPPGWLEEAVERHQRYCRGAKRDEEVGT